MVKGEDIDEEDVNWCIVSMGGSTVKLTDCRGTKQVGEQLRLSSWWTCPVAEILTD